VQIVADPAGFTAWSAPVEPGGVHDITAARAHCLGALYAAAGRGLLTLADKALHVPPDLSRSHGWEAWHPHPHIDDSQLPSTPGLPADARCHRGCPGRRG
jgi:hypothetical protein